MNTTSSFSSQSQASFDDIIEPVGNEAGADFSWYLPLLEAALRGDQESIRLMARNVASSSQSQANVASSSQPVQNTDGKDINWYLPLYKAAIRGDWESASRFFELDPDAITAKISMHSKTALHLAVGTGKANHFVEKLVERMSPDALAMVDNYGATALSAAATVGNIEAAKLLVNKNPDLLYVRDNEGTIPLLRATQYGHKDLVLYFLEVTRDDVEPNPFADESGAKLLVVMVVSGFYDLALDLVQRYPGLVKLHVYDQKSALSLLAGLPYAFPSGRGLNVWQRLIYSCIPEKLETFPHLTNGGDMENPTDSSQVCAEMCFWFQFVRGNHFTSAWAKLHTILWDIIEGFVPYVKHIRDTKLKHYQALQLVKRLCAEAASSDSSEASSILRMPTLLASAYGIHEIVEEIAESYPSAIWFCDHEGRNIFHLAVKFRHENVFNLIYQMNDHKHYVTQSLDDSGNNILHLAGNLAPQRRLNLVSGAALQMQRELQWFKEVEKYVQPAYKEAQNSNGKTPQMVFSKEHENLVKEGEKWIKDTANSCTVAAALIATVVFAAAITVPGGSNGDNGRPIFYKEKAFITFAVSDALSLFSSTAAVLMFLSILTSRYAESDFLYSLPRRLILGLVTLFLSITSMMIAFSATLYLVFGERKAWILVTVAAGACLPVTLFVSLQFLLLVDMIYSTYGPGIFGKKSERPFH